MSGSSAAEPACTLASAVFFLVALIAGTGCTIVNKSTFSMQSIAVSGEVENFQAPIFMTTCMFAGMSFGIPAHYLLSYYRHVKARTDPEERKLLDAEPPVTVRTFAMLAVPAVFDLMATALTNLGLLSVDASVWQLLRGGVIVFVAVMKHYVLKDLLHRAQWVGVFIIAVATALVGVSSTLGDKKEAVASASSQGPLVGVFFTVSGTFMTSLQYVYEEKVMGGEVQAPPWLLIGTEGVCGLLLCTLILYPLAYVAPGSDHGSFENPYNTWSLIANSPALCGMIALYTFLIFLLNALSVLITLMMSSVWHAILDNFRPVCVWICQLALFYCLTAGALGEEWSAASYLQLAGMIVLLGGTAVYNGSIQLPGVQAENLLMHSSLKASPRLARSPLLPSGPELERAFHDLPAGTPRQNARLRLAPPPSGNLKEGLLQP